MTLTPAAMIAICGVILQQLVICFTPSSLTWLVYVAGVPAILGICITTVCRSLITKVKYFNFFDSLSYQSKFHSGRRRPLLGPFPS